MKTKDFSGYMDMYSDMLLSYALYLCTHNKENAEDLYQDTLLQAYSHFDRFDGTNFYGWTSRIMKNLFINRVRKQNMVELSMLENSMDVRCDSDESGDIFELIEKLPSRYNEIITLRLQGFSYIEISNFINVPIGTVKSRIYLARNAIKDYYKKHCL